MSDYRKLFLICDPAMQSTAAFERAAALAKRTGADLHMCLFDHSEAIAAIGIVDHAGMEQAKQAFVEQRRASVQRIAADLGAAGIRASADAAWSRPAHVEMLSQISELKPDLVIKDVHHEPLLKRLLFTPTDWHLLRECTAPLLLVRRGAHIVPRRIIVAIDPGPYDPQSAAINKRIIDAALAFALQCDAKVHLAFAFDSASAVLATMPGPAPTFSIDAYNTLLDTRRRAFDALADERGVPNNRRHFLSGAPGRAIAEFAAEHETDVIVLGSVHRSRFDRLVMGSTAEQILEHAPCSVLVVHP